MIVRERVQPNFVPI